ncbi:MAG: hypothetical protein J5658_10760 [Prevotella sp.]|nr:hypothetical protein [Prevotella sp.]
MKNSIIGKRGLVMSVLLFHLLTLSLSHLLTLSPSHLLTFSPLYAQRMDNVTTHSKYIQAVDEYRPAPGQYVNDVPEYEEGDTEADMIRKCNENLAGLGPIDSHLVALGGWGGYITFHFDHSIANIPGQRDFAVWGNAYQEMRNLVFGGMNEAGIVMVSKDVNGNGLPDDPWYEISGSCDVDSVGKVIYGYEVTYHKNPMGDIPWTDNRGGNGTIDRNHYHMQEYYPLWLPDGLTFRGTRLPDNMQNLSDKVDNAWSPYYYVLVGFRYGYADNLPNFTDKADATSYNYEGCGIDISWAVDENRQPIHLDFIDFVRVYTGLNQKCPQPEWWGETSTEFAGAEDIHLESSLAAIRQAQEMARKADVDGDGHITARDITAITDVIFGKTDRITPQAADVNGDGNVTVADIICVVNMINSQLY